jgi:TonB-linked SusC/RagA family outer membrane protein
MKISLLLTFLFMITLGTTLNAQNLALNIKGVVYDEFGKPLSGAIISSEKGRNHASTDETGAYTITVNDGSSYIEFSFLGYANKRAVLGEKNDINANLRLDASNRDEQIQLGYTSTSRNNLTGSVATVSGEELKKSPVANNSLTLEGRLPGLFTKVTATELSRSTTGLYVRGQSTQPMLIVDGVSTNYKTIQTLDYISADEIESITILKDASAEALYGIQGSNGVIVVTTKRGKQSKLKMNVRFDESVQQVTTKPTFISSAEYATLRNEASINDGGSAIYSDEAIAKFKSGADPILYPNTNWYDLFMNKYAQMQRLNLSAQGGNNRLQYYTNINLMNQGSQFKTDHPAYSSNEHFSWINFRSNLNAELNTYLSAHLDLSGNIKHERTPGSSFSNDVYDNIFQIPSAIYGPTTPRYIDPTTLLAAGNEVVATTAGESPYGILNRSGYTDNVVTNINAHFGLDLDMSFLTKGLKLSGTFAYQTNTVDALANTQTYARYVGSTSNDTLTYTQKGTTMNTDLTYSKTSSYYYNLTYKGLMNYDRTFGLHHVSGTGFAFYQRLNTNDTSSPGLLPYTRIHTGLDATYDYDQKYILKLDAGYSGSEAYRRGNRFTLTPAISGAWVASRESFMSGLDWLTNLKFKASYGRTADDTGVGRYAYADNDSWGTGGSIGTLIYNITEGTVGNPNIKPEICTKQNYGIDLGFFNELAFGLDVFNERINNALINGTASIPTIQGVSLSNYPETNTGESKIEGYDFTANFTKALAKDLTVSLGGFLSYAKNTTIYSGEAEKSSDYAYRYNTQGYSANQSWGYLVDYSNGNGFFNTSTELANSHLVYNVGGSAPRVGDLIYKDLNNDGIIDEKDKAPLGTGSMPRYYFGISGGATYKSFDLSFLFQGIGQYHYLQSGTGIYGTDYDGVYGSLLENAWTADRYNSKAKITAPALTLGSNTSSLVSSDYYLYDKSYVRLKNVEIGYTLPKSITQAISADKIRFILSGQNLFTWDHMKSKDFGPEGGYTTVPVYRVYNVGISLIF